MAKSSISAQDIKKGFQKIQGSGLEPSEVLAKLATHDAVVRMLQDTFPQIEAQEVREVLGQMTALFNDMQDWAAPSKKKETARKKETAISPDLDDPAAIAACDRVKIHVDGASKGNPGPASAGIVITDLEDLPVYEEALFLGTMTNNAAEYHGLIRALELCVENGRPEAYVFADSELVVKQMNGVYRVKNPDMQKLFSRAQKLKSRLRIFQMVHVRREHNQRADELANIAIKQARDAAKI